MLYLQTCNLLASHDWNIEDDHFNWDSNLRPFVKRGGGVSFDRQTEVATQFAWLPTIDYYSLSLSSWVLTADYPMDCKKWRKVAFRRVHCRSVVHIIAWPVSLRVRYTTNLQYTYISKPNVHPICPELGASLHYFKLLTTTLSVWVAEFWLLSIPWPVEIGTRLLLTWCTADQWWTKLGACPDSQ